MFISIDGPNGSGKTTIINELGKKLRAENKLVYITKEPTNSLIGTIIRDYHQEIMSYSLACLLAADRYNHLQSEIIPALERGVFVISDRYIASSLVYQQIDGVEKDFIEKINSKIILPDLHVFIFCRHDQILERLSKRSHITRFESDFLGEYENSAFYDVANDYISYGYNVLCIDNSNNYDIDTNVSLIRDMIVKLCGKNGTR